MKSQEEIQEPKERAVFTFGRFNPPTPTGHGKVLDKVKHLAKHHGADHHVFVSSSQDRKKNPLNHTDKIKYMKQMFPGTNICVDPSVKNPIDVLKYLSKLGYKKVTMVVGDDRLQAMNNLLQKYNNTKEYSFDDIKVVSAGQRDPDAEGSEGASASKMREAAHKSNFKEFSKGIKDQKLAKDMYSSVRRGLKMNENNALFLVGGPGSGKDFLIEHIGNGATEIPLSKLIQCIDERTSLPELDGRYVIINGNADQQRNIDLSRQVLEAMGYKTGMVYVYTTNEESKNRNDARIRVGAKTISEETRTKKYSSSVSAMHSYKDSFGENFIIFDNSRNLKVTDDMTRWAKLEEVESWVDELKIIVEGFFETKTKLDELFEEAIEDKPKKKKTTKAALPPTTAMDIRVDGGAATNVFGYAGEEVGK